MLQLGQQLQVTWITVDWRDHISILNLGNREKCSLSELRSLDRAQQMTGLSLHSLEQVW